MNAIARAYVPAISARMRAMAHRFAHKYELEVADLLQQSYVIVNENAGNYDAGRGGSRQTYLINCLENYCKQERSRMRFGVELDAAGLEDDKGMAEAAEFEIAQMAAEDALSVVDMSWRNASNAAAVEKLQSFTPQNRRIATLLIEGKSTREAAQELGLTARRVRQVIEEIVDLFSAGAVPVQPTLF